MPNKYKFKVTVEKDPNATIANKFKGFLVSKAQVKLMQVTRDGKLRMQFLAPMLSSELVKNFKN
jgi:hypothetical protein